MDNDFLNWLYKYPSVASLQKLTILKAKYLQNDADINYIHITGTNGKGSVARYLNSILLKIMSKKVGIFTSPHITKINERIVVDNIPISDVDLVRIKKLIIDDVEKYQLGFFAILTLMALIYFQEQKVKIAIIEVGIGGLLDATNIIKSDYVILTALGYDHEKLLGKNLTTILKQKLGIIKPTTKKVFVSNTIPKFLQKIIKLKVAKNLFFSSLISDNYLLNNQDLALLVAQNLFPNFLITTSMITDTDNLLRFQKLTIANKIIYLDVAHNVMGIKALRSLLQINAITIDKIIFSALVDKHPTKMLSILKNISDKIIVCQNSHHKSIVGLKFDLQKMILKDNSVEVLLITGSCYFVGEVYNLLLDCNKN